MERAKKRSQTEIRRIADRAQERAIRTKKQRGEPLLPEELQLEDRKRESAAARAEYRSKYPSYDTFYSAVINAAGELTGVEDEDLSKAAETAAENNGLLQGITNDALRGGILAAVLAARLFSHADIMARSASLTVYTSLVKWLEGGDV